MDVGSLYDVVRNYTHQPTTTTTTEADVDEALAELYDAFYPNDGDHPAAPEEPNPQPIQQVSSFADLIDQHPFPPDAAAIALEERRRQEEIYRLTWHSIEARRQLMLWENKYVEQQQTLQQLQRVNHLLVDCQPPLGRSNNGGRTRKRKSRSTEKKNQKSVYMVSAANLVLMDEWAWRKYGRKPVKGSSFLRSYYKCTSAIECKARKQVEKCLVEPEIYLVSYSGEHTHPGPVQRTEPDGSEKFSQTGGFSVPDNIVPYEAVEVPNSPPLAPPPPPQTPAVADSLLPEVAAPMQVPPIQGGETAVPVTMPNTMLSEEDWFSGMQEPGSLDCWINFDYDGSGSGSYEPGFYN